MEILNFHLFVCEKIIYNIDFLIWKFIYLLTFLPQNKPKVKAGKTEESLQDTEVQEQDNKSENQSTGREATLDKSEAGEVTNEETASGGENELESMNSEENSDEELDESAHSESEEEEIKDSSAPVVEAAVWLSSVLEKLAVFCCHVLVSIVFPLWCMCSVNIWFTVFPLILGL